MITIILVITQNPMLCCNIPVYDRRKQYEQDKKNNDDVDHGRHAGKPYGMCFGDNEYAGGRILVTRQLKPDAFKGDRCG